MSDHDRGAYTPQTDPPLAFDPRRPSERRPMPMALIGSGVVLVVLLAGVAMVYRGGVRQAGESPRPVGEPVMAVKTAPTAAQTAAASAAAPPTADVYTPAPANQTAAASKLAPPPEQPVARPPPSPATVALLSKPAAPDHIERPSAADVTPPPAVKPAPHAKVDETELAAATGGGHASHLARPPEAAPDATAEATESAAAKPTSVATTPPAKPVPTPTPTKPTVVASTPATAAAAGPAVVQIGAFSSAALADQGYADVSSALPDRMAGKAKHVLALDKGGATLYRTWLSGFATRADAVSFCEALKAKGKTCFVKGV